MNRDKQIEEIRNDIFAAFGGYAKWEEDWQSLAEAVYNAGYRKQSEGEWIRQDKGKGRVAPEAVCSNCGRDVEYQVIDGKWAFENYCPHCGAKMKGWQTQKINVERE